MESPGQNPDCLGDNKLFFGDTCKFRQILFFQTACHRLVEGRLAYNFSLVDGFLFCESVKRSFAFCHKLG